MDREYADNKSNTGNSARISEMEQGELSYFLKLFEYLRDALNNAPTSFMSRGNAKTMDAKLSRATKWIAIVFIILTLAIDLLLLK